MRAAYTRTAGVRHLFAACEPGEDKLSGHIKPRKTRARFLEFCRYLRSLSVEQQEERLVVGQAAGGGRLPARSGGSSRPSVKAIRRVTG